MANKVKLFEETDYKKVEQIINKFTAENQVNVVEVKTCATPTSHIVYSIIIIYEEDTQ